jgi:hypothetical protein
MYDENSPILGSATVDAARVAAYIVRRPTGEYTEHDIANVIVPAYFRLGAQVGIDAVLAVAQLLHETGNLTSFWAARPRRNPAGIGVTGQSQPDQPINTAAWAFDPSSNLWRFGVSFGTWEHDAVPAHLGRLLAYALPPAAETPAHAALLRQALAYRPFPARMRGSAPVLRQLGKAHNPSGQGWASPGVDYGARIAAIANRIIAE